MKPTVPNIMSIILHPGRLTWNLQITHLERKMIFHTSMIMFHVNLQGCKSLNSSMNPPEPSINSIAKDLNMSTTSSPVEHCITMMIHSLWIPTTFDQSLPAKQNLRCHEQKPSYTFHYTGWFIGIFIMVYFNPYITG